MATGSLPRYRLTFLTVAGPWTRTTAARRPTERRGTRTRPRRWRGSPGRCGSRVRSRGKTAAGVPKKCPDARGRTAANTAGARPYGTVRSNVHEIVVRCHDPRSLYGPDQSHPAASSSYAAAPAEASTEAAAVEADARAEPDPARAEHAGPGPTRAEHAEPVVRRVAAASLPYGEERNRSHRSPRISRRRFSRHSESPFDSRGVSGGLYWRFDYTRR